LALVTKNKPKPKQNKNRAVALDGMALFCFEPKLAKKILKMI